MARVKDKNNQGFTLIQVIMTMGILGIVSLGVATLLQSLSDVQDRAKRVTGLKAALTEFEIALKSTRGREQTINAAANDALLECLRPGSTSDCSTVMDESGQTTTFIQEVYNPSGTGLIYKMTGTMPDGTPAKNGLDWNGNPCNNPNPATASAQCPISLRFHIHQISCPNGGGCPGADTVVTSVMTSFTGPSTQKSIPLNLNNYVTRVLWDGDFSLANLCTEFNGTWDPVNNTCTYNDASTLCNNGNGNVGGYLIGLDADFRPICGHDACGPGKEFVQMVAIPGASTAPQCQNIVQSDDTCPNGQRLVGVRRNPGSVAGGKVEKVCVNHSAAAQPTCPNGEAARRIVWNEANKRFEVDLASCQEFAIAHTCPANEVLVKSPVVGSGNPICVPKRPGSGCSPGSFVESVNADGSVVCRGFAGALLSTPAPAIGYGHQEVSCGDPDFSVISCQCGCMNDAETDWITNSTVPFQEVATHYCASRDLQKCEGRCTYGKVYVRAVCARF